MSDWDDDDLVPEPGYDPREAIDAALDAGLDPVVAQEQAQQDAMEWLLAESGGGRVTVIAEYEARRRRDPHRRRYMRDYMRRYRKLRKTA